MLCFVSASALALCLPGSCNSLIQWSQSLDASGILQLRSNLGCRLSSAALYLSIEACKGIRVLIYMAPLVCMVLLACTDYWDLCFC